VRKNRSQCSHRWYVVQLSTLMFITFPSQPRKGFSHYIEKKRYNCYTALLRVSAGQSEMKITHLVQVWQPCLRVSDHHYLGIEFHYDEQSDRRHPKDDECDKGKEIEAFVRSEESLSQRLFHSSFWQQDNNPLRRDTIFLHVIRL
jgi:hypothetical protein